MQPEKRVKVILKFLWFYILNWKREAKNKIGDAEFESPQNNRLEMIFVNYEKHS